MSLASRTVTLLLISLLAATSFPDGTARAAGAEAINAGDYLVSTFKPGTDAAYGDAGSAADSLLALASTGDAKYGEDIAGILAFLQDQAEAYVKPDASGTSGAAKLALVAAVTSTDARDFGGVDLIANIKAGIGADGSFGAWPGPFASGLAMVALARNSEEVPDTMVNYLLTYAEPRANGAGGGFGCSTYPFKKDGDCPASDPDSTGMAVLGLRAAGTATSTAAANDALEWLTSTQQADGSWQNFSPVNSTGLVGPLFPAGSEQATKATAYVISCQLDSGALTTGTDSKANLIATQQGLLALTQKTYLTIGARELSATSSPTPSGAATALPSTPPSSEDLQPNLPLLYGAGVLGLVAFCWIAYLGVRQGQS